MHSKSFWINSFSAAWSDGWVCVACWDTWGANSGFCCVVQGKEGMSGWQWNHHGVGTTVPLLTSAPCCSFFLKNVHINTCALTHTHRHIYAHAHRQSSGLSPDLLNLASDSGTCYWKGWPKFYAFDLGGEKYCKGYQHGRGRPAPIVSPVHYYTYKLKQTLALTSN